MNSRIYTRVMSRLTRLVVLAATAACVAGPTPSATPALNPSALGPLALVPRVPLTAPQQRWVDSTLATLSLRQRVGQMVMIWMLGDYTNTRDTTYAQIIRW